MTQKVLVTGGNGFLAAQVIIAALRRDYSVIATVRSQLKAEQTRGALGKRLTPTQLEKLSFEVVPDITKEDAFDHLFQSNSFDAVLHTATPFHYRFTDPYELLDPAIGSTKVILNSIHSHAPTVKRVVITSSFAAVKDFRQNFRPGYVYTEKDWNPVTWEEAIGTHKGTTYRGAKKFAEKAAWDFMESIKPNFDLVVLNPPLVFGDTAQYVESLDSLNTSTAAVYNFLSGKLEEIPEQHVMNWTDVVTTGEAHIDAIERPEAGGHRIVISNGVFTNKQVAEILREICPDRADKVPTKLSQNVDSDGYPVDGYDTVSNELSCKLLGTKYGTLREALLQTLESIRPLMQ